MAKFQMLGISWAALSILKREREREIRIYRIAVWEAHSLVPAFPSRKGRGNGKF